MKKHKIGVSVLLLFLLMSFQTDKPAYQIFDAAGKKSSYQSILEKAQEADIILFGESHNNPIIHWLQIELTKDLYKILSKNSNIIKEGKIFRTKNNLILGAEIFEADNQTILDEYLNDIITEKNFEAEARLWNNYKTDYKPLVEFAKENNLDFVATNIPRRYASLVSKKGLSSLDELSEDAKRFMMPLPIEVDLKMPAYANMLKMMGVHSTSDTETVSEGAANFAYAQAVKDATMAYRINEYYKQERVTQNKKAEKKNSIFLHFNGSYHSDNYESIVYYLRKYNPSLKIMTITAADQKDLDVLEKTNVADFAIVTPLSMTKTY
ncbi:ChaN family lipoprotein [Bernardetia sp. OM2101]|uniref:ChaN family lipoprotein n=1 Tax=Bernardetia sp. OM2101 TaxID=3344876 RepID=UPI0035CEC306